MMPKEEIIDPELPESTESEPISTTASVDALAEAEPMEEPTESPKEENIKHLEIADQEENPEASETPQHAPVPVEEAQTSVPVDTEEVTAAVQEKELEYPTIHEYSSDTVTESPQDSKPAEVAQEESVPDESLLQEPVHLEKPDSSTILVEAMAQAAMEESRKSSASSIHMIPAARTAADGPVVPVSSITAPVRSTNPGCPVFSMTHGSALAAALATNTHLKSLNLSGCGLQTPNTIELADALKKNASLEVLNLDNNAIQPAGMRALARMLEVNRAIKELRLAQQKYLAGTEAEQAFASALQKNQTLVKFSLQVKDSASRTTIDRYTNRNKDIERKQRLAANGK